MLNKILMVLSVSLFGYPLQAMQEELSEYTRNWLYDVYDSALNRVIISSSHFLSEIDRLEQAGADFAHSERLCRLKYLDDLFDIDHTLENEKNVIQKAIDEIDSNPVGQQLVNALYKYLQQYPTDLIKELKQKKKIDLEDEILCLNQLNSYNKIFLRKGEKTLFGCPKPIPHNSDYWADKLDSYKVCFQLGIDLKDCNGALVSLLWTQDTETVLEQVTSFSRILLHELVHILDFLFDSKSYRQNNIRFQWNPFLNALWPSLSGKHDGLKLAESWDGRMTEVKAVIGEEFDPDLEDTMHIGRFSELSFAIAAGEKSIRLPYAMCEMVIHRETATILFENGSKHAQFHRTTKTNTANRLYIASHYPSLASKDLAKVRI
jgi:hypothetical protein